MHFNLKRMPLYSSILAFLALTTSSGCGLLGTKNQPGAANPGTTGCLNNSKDLVGRYVGGEISQTEWKSAFDCVNQSLDFFTDYVRGSSVDAYTQEDMYTLVSRFLITNRPVHEELMHGAFSLKAALFGGTARSFKKEEIDLMKASLGRLRDITSDLIPYLAVRQKENPSPEELMEMVSAFKRAGDQLADFMTTLPTDILSEKAIESLITELTVSLNLPAIDDLSQTAFLAKWMVFNTRRDAIESKDWPQLFKTSMSLGGIMLAFQASVGTDLNSPRHQVADRLKNDYRFREFVYELALQAKPYLDEIIVKHGGVVPYPLFDHLIDSLPSSLFDNLPKQTLKQTLKPLFRKFLISSTQVGLDQGVIDTVYTLMGETVQDLGMLDRFYEKTGLDLYDVKAPVFTQTINQYAAALTNSAEKARFNSIKSKLLSYKPLFSKNTSSIRFEAGVGYTKLQGFVVLGMDRIARHLQNTYGSKTDVFVPDDLIHFFRDYTDILFALKVVDPTVPNFGPKRLQDMDLFTPNGDGNGEASIQELVSYSMMIISAGDLTTRMRREITAKCDRNLGQDLMGWTWVPADCFRNEFHARLTYWIDEFPRLKRYWDTVAPQDQEKALVWLEHGSRRNGYSQEDFGKFDIGAMATVLHYTESLFTRFDVNQSEVLGKSEVGEAFPVFKTLLAKKAKVSESNEYLLKGIFTYIVRYREMPETAGVGNISKLAYWLGIYNLPTTNYQADREGVFNIVCQLAAPESTSQADLTKTICQ